MYDRMNPFVRVAVGVSSYNIEMTRRVGADHRMFFINSGSAKLTIKGQTHLLSAHDAVYIPADTDYEFSFSSTDEPFYLTVINFDFDSERSEQRTTIYPTPFERYGGEKLYTGYTPKVFENSIFLKNADYIGAEIGRIRRLFFEHEKNYRAYSSAILKTVLLRISDSMREDGGGLDTAAGIISYIKENYAKRLLAKEVAARFNYHPNHLNRLVKRATGRGFKEYLIHYRLVVARDMLLTSSDSVTAISESCGFTSPSYFAELFTAWEGISPREYRRRARESIL